MLDYLTKVIPDVAGTCQEEGGIRVDFSDNSSRYATDIEILEAKKLYTIDKLKQACTSQIQAGFTSDALGTAYTYQSALPQDQMNLMGAAMLGVDLPFTCIDSTGYKSKLLHTAAQMKQVFLTGAAHIEAATTKYDILKKQVEDATTIESIDGVSW
jgi:hypothetical protein